MKNKNDYFKYEPGQAVEQLHFTVKPELIEEFIRLDTLIWTDLLSKFDGFVKKEVWISETKPSEVFTLTYWKEKKYWEMLDENLLAENSKRFTEAFGGSNFVFNTPLHVGNQKYCVRVYNKNTEG